MLHSRTFWLVATVTMMSGGMIGACSSSSDNGFASDGGNDGTFGDGSSDGSKSDASGDGSTGNETGTTSCPEITLSGTCDLVLQNCEAGNECDPILNADNSVTAQCVPQSSGSVPLGHECCPDNNNGNCVSGTACQGPPCTVTDGGPGTKSGRCSPYCCPSDNAHCGSSNPEGVPGVCNLTVSGTNPVDGGEIQFGDTCNYSTACKPFGVQPCGPSATCTLADDGVSFRCVGLFSVPGQDAGTLCNSGNACKSGLECIGPLDAGATCTLMCYQRDGGGAPPPFDAAALPMTPGFGGCYAGQTCAGTLIGGPTWYGFCAP